MNPLRHRTAVVITSYAVTYGAFATYFYYVLATHQRPEDHPKYPPSSAFVWAALYATAFFAAVAVIWLVGAVIWATVSSIVRLLKRKRIT
jgi:hypothetical protein